MALYFSWEKKYLRTALLICYGMLFAVPVAHCQRPSNNLGLFITGLSGAHDFRVQFFQACLILRNVLLENGFTGDDLMRFSESGQDALPWQRHETATRLHLERAMESLRLKQEAPYDRVFVFIAGHTNGRDEKAMFHLLGEDVSYETMMEWVDAIPAKQLILVLAASQGHIWIERLSRENRILIIGSGLREFDFIPKVFLQLFPRAFLHAPKTLDENKTESLSLKDIFIQTQIRIQNWYRLNGLYPTELAFLDADGDGKGQSLFYAAPQRDPVSGDGVAPARPAAPEGTLDTYDVQVPKRPFSIHLVPAIDGTLEPLMDESAPEAAITKEILFNLPGGKTHGN